MDAPTLPLPIIALAQLGDPAAAACEGDFCAIPDHHQQAVVNRKLDEDLV